MHRSWITWARSLSLFYALIGGLLVIISMDVERHRAIIRYMGWGSLIAGVLMTGIGLHAGIPTWWVIHEGPAAAGIGVAVLWLQRPRG